MKPSIAATESKDEGGKAMPPPSLPKAASKAAPKEGSKISKGSSLKDKPSDDK